MKILIVEDDAETASYVSNGLRHTPEGTDLSVRLERIAGGIRLSASDHGPGIPAEERDRVFSRFYRLDRTRTTAGSGLGLSLVAAIVKLHGARVRLEDNAPGLSVVVELVDAEPRSIGVDAIRSRIEAGDHAGARQRTG